MSKTADISADTQICQLMKDALELAVYGGDIEELVDRVHAAHAQKDITNPQANELLKILCDLEGLRANDLDDDDLREKLKPRHLMKERV